MNRIPQADWAANVPVTGVLGLRDYVQSAVNTGIQSGSVDLNDVVWDGVRAGHVYWNGSAFVPTTIAAAGGTNFTTVNQPGVAVRRRKQGLPYGDYENVFVRDEFNVKQYGAKGDGAFDDTTAINSVVDAVNVARGGKIVIPAGRYNAKDFNTINYSCAIVGAGAGVTVIDCGYGDGFHFYGTGTFSASGLSLERSSTGFLVECKEAFFDDISISTDYKGFALNGPSIVRISDFYGVSLGTSAIGVYGTAGTINTDNLNFLGGGAYWNYGIYLASGTACAIENTYVNGALNDGIYLGTEADNNRINNVLAANVLGDIVENNGSGNFITNVQGLGGNTDTRFDSRKDLNGRVSWAPGGIQPGYGFYDDFTLSGVGLGDQVIFGAELGIPPWVIAQAHPSAADTVRASVINMGTSAIFLGTAIWRFRAFN